MSTSTQTIEQLTAREYKYGFVTDVEQDAVPRGLDEEIVRLISLRWDSQTERSQQRWRVSCHCVNRNLVTLELLEIGCSYPIPTT